MYVFGEIKFAVRIKVKPWGGYENYGVWIKDILWYIYSGANQLWTPNLWWLPGTKIRNT